MTSNTSILTDERDGNSYPTIKIGHQVWLAKNLAYKPSSGNFWPFDDNLAYIDNYGYLYDWATAKMVAPKGWHLPTFQEWVTLYRTLGNESGKVYYEMMPGGSSGFNAIMAGSRGAKGSFGDLRTDAYFWSATIDDQDTRFVLYFLIGSQWRVVSVRNSAAQSAGLSIRLIRD